MEGLSKCLGSPIPLRIAGKTSLLKPITLGVLGVMENTILAGRSTPLEEVKKILPKLEKEARADLMDLAYKDTKERRQELGRVSGAEMHRWLNTGVGIDMTLWLCLYNHWEPRFVSLEDAAAVASTMNDGDRAVFLKRRDICSGTDLLSQLDWAEAGQDKDQGEERQPMPWREMIRNLADEFHCYEDVIANWTLYQLNVHRGRKEDLGGTVTMSAGEALAYAKAKGSKTIEGLGGRK